MSLCKDTGTIGLDYTNFQQCRDLMIDLRSNPSMRDEWREMAFEFWKQHSDGKDVVNEIIELATSNESQPQGLEEFF